MTEYTKADLTKAKAALRLLGDGSKTEVEKKVAELLFKEREAVIGQFEYLWQHYLGPALRGDPTGLVNTLRIQLSKARKPKLTLIEKKDPPNEKETM